MEKRIESFVEILSKEEIPLEEFFKLSKEINSSIVKRESFEKLLEDFTPISKRLSTENKINTRNGIAFWILGNYEKAVEILEQTRLTKESSFFLGISYLDLGKIELAYQNLKEAYQIDRDDRLVQLYFAEVLMKKGEHERAKEILQKIQKKDQENPDLYYLWGLYHDFCGDYELAYDFYEKACQIEPSHTKSKFRMAYNLDMWGNELRAQELYEEISSQRPRDLNGMINLGVIYEDKGDYQRAKECFEEVLRYYPNHPRARRYLEDVIASMNMYYDEEEMRRKARLASLLTTTVEDLGLSLRVEELLKEHGIRTVGDLVKKTELELRSIENLGKIALDEIKEAMHIRGVTLAPAEGETGIHTEPIDEKKAEVLNKPLSDFEWPGRIKKVFEKLSIFTIGDLIKYSEKDLLAHKNLGLTSIREIRRKLEPLGVSLRQEKRD
jgi:DNA-directed RNA polymerase subunit alpha